MRISDWSSDVCSSDLIERQAARNGQRTDVIAAGSEDAATGDAHITADGADAAERRARSHAGQAGRGQLVAVDQQRTGIHRRRAGVAVSGRQRDDARTVLRYRARAGNQTGEADIVQAIEYERTIVRYIASDEAAGSTITKLQRSSPDGRAASIAVIGGQDGCARSKLIDGTGTGYLASDRQRAGSVELERAIVRNVACRSAEHTPELQSLMRY